MGNFPKGSNDDRNDLLPARISKATDLLLEAYRYARSLEQDLWNFSVEIKILRDLGLTQNDFRWLVCRGLVEHAREVTRVGDDDREFQPTGKLLFSKRTCFVLTEAGVAFSEAINGAAPESRQYEGPVKESHSNGLSRPSWDCDRRELRVGDHVVKQFKLPSPNQEQILMVFQEEGWPARIDDPLPPATGADPRQRLRDTIKSLNRHQKEHLICFKGDGTGEGVLWEFVPASTD